MATAEEDIAFRCRLVDSGAFEEILRVLVALGEAPKSAGAETKVEPMDFLLDNFGKGMLPPLVQPRHASDPDTSYEVVQENQHLKSRLAELRSRLKSAREQLRLNIPEGRLKVFGIAACGVPDADTSGGTSDPFIRVSLLDVPNLEETDEGEDPERDLDPMAFREYCAKHHIAAQTTTMPNQVDPAWPDEVLEIVLPAGTPRPPRVLVRVWDNDQTKDDDPLASLAVQLEPNGGKFEHLVLKGRAGLPDVEVSFEYTMLDIEGDTSQEPVNMS